MTYYDISLQIALPVGLTRVVYFQLPSLQLHSLLACYNFSRVEYFATTGTDARYTIQKGKSKKVYFFNGMQHRGHNIA